MLSLSKHGVGFFNGLLKLNERVYGDGARQTASGSWRCSAITSAAPRTDSGGKRGLNPVWPRRTLGFTETKRSGGSAVEAASIPEE